MLGLKSLPFLEVMVFVIHSFGALRIESLGGRFLPGLSEEEIKRSMPRGIASVMKEAKELIRKGGRKEVHGCLS